MEGVMRLRLGRLISMFLALGLVVVLVLSLFPAPVRAVSSDWESGYTYRKRITIDSDYVSGTSNLSSFPVLINIASDDDLRTTGNDGHMEHASGWDTHFTSADGTTDLYHEIEDYDDETGEYVAWVNVTSLSHDTDTIIYMYYGKSGVAADPSSTSTWNTNYQMVQHLQETTGTHYDSTNHGMDGTNNGSTQDAAGMVDGANSFDGSAYITITDDTYLRPTDAVTFEVWAQTTGDPAQWDTLGGTSTTDEWEDGYGLWYESTSTVRFHVMGYGTNFAESGIIPTNWNYIVGTYDKDAGGVDEIKIYVNGVLGGTVADYSTAITYTDTFCIAHMGISEGFTGTIDEVRISNTARSVDWILTSYNNQSSPGDFYSVGVEQIGTWYSHTDSERSGDEEDTFASPNTTVYMKGTNLATSTSHRVAYYDAGASGGQKVATVTTSTDGSGALDNNQYLLTTDPGATAGTWHALLQLASSEAFPTNYNDATIGTGPATYGLLANDEFTVEESAIPEFPTVFAAIGVAGLCFGIYWWMRKRLKFKMQRAK